MDSPLTNQQSSASLLETDYSQSPSGLAYVLKESQNLSGSAAAVSPKLSPYPSKQGVTTLTDITQKLEQSSARRESLMEDIKNKNREHLERVKQVRRSLVEKEMMEQQLKKQQIEEKLLSAQENKMKDLENIKDKCYKEERKVQLALLRAAEKRGGSTGVTTPSKLGADGADNDDNMEN